MLTNSNDFVYKDPIGVVGFDVAGDEGSYPLQSVEEPMSPGALRAIELGVPVTVHAGEWPEKYQTVQNIRFKLKHDCNQKENINYCSSKKQNCV